MHTADIPYRPQDTLKLTDQYIALLILVFTNAGLLDVSAITQFSRAPIDSTGAGIDVNVRRVERWLCIVSKGYTAYG